MNKQQLTQEELELLESSKIKAITIDDSYGKRFLLPIRNMVDGRESLYIMTLKPGDPLEGLVLKHNPRSKREREASLFSLPLLEGQNFKDIIFDILREYVREPATGPGLHLNLPRLTGQAKDVLENIIKNPGKEFQGLKYDGEERLNDRMALTLFATTNKELFQSKEFLHLPNTVHKLTKSPNYFFYEVTNNEVEHIYGGVTIKQKEAEPDSAGSKSLLLALKLNNIIHYNIHTLNHVIGTETEEQGNVVRFRSTDMPLGHPLLPEPYILNPEDLITIDQIHDEQREALLYYPHIDYGDGISEPLGPKFTHQKQFSRHPDDQGENILTQIISIDTTLGAENLTLEEFVFPDVDPSLQPNVKYNLKVTPDRMRSWLADGHTIGDLISFGYQTKWEDKDRLTHDMVGTPILRIHEGEIEDFTSLRGVQNNHLRVGPFLADQDEKTNLPPHIKNVPNAGHHSGNYAYAHTLHQTLMKGALNCDYEDVNEFAQYVFSGQAAKDNFIRMNTNLGSYPDYHDTLRAFKAGAYLGVDPKSSHLHASPGFAIHRAWPFMEQGPNAVKDIKVMVEKSDGNMTATMLTFSEDEYQRFHKAGKINHIELVSLKPATPLSEPEKPKFFTPALGPDKPGLRVIDPNGKPQTILREDLAAQYPDGPLGKKKSNAKVRSELKP